MSMVAQKLFATWWAIAFGIAAIAVFFNQNDPDNWSNVVGAVIYLGLFLMALFEIKTKESIFMWFWRRHKKKQTPPEEQFRWTR